MFKALINVAARRLAGAIPTVILLSMVVFFVLRALPADPLALLLPPNATQADAEVVRHALGLDRSIAVQYLIWLRDAVAGNLGSSIAFREPVTRLLANSLPATLELSFVGARLGADHQHSRRASAVRYARHHHREHPRCAGGLHAVDPRVPVGDLPDARLWRDARLAAVFRPGRFRDRDSVRHRLPADRLCRESPVGLLEECTGASDPSGIRARARLSARWSFGCCAHRCWNRRKITT